MSKKLISIKTWKLLLKALIKKYHLSTATLIDNSLVITQSISQIKKIINSERVDDNLSSNSKYLNFKNLKSKKKFIFYG